MFDALGQTIAKAWKIRELNEAIQETIPDEGRGSYYWWARLCRQYTGQSIFDSGMFYGYQYNRPVADEHSDFITISFREGKFESVTMHLPGFLWNLLDAADETATALQEVFDWFADYLVPQMTWGDTIEAFFYAIQDIKLCFAEKNLRKRRLLSDRQLDWLARYVDERWKYESKRPIHDGKFGLSDLVIAAWKNVWYDSELPSHRRKMTADEYAYEAVKDFPRKAFRVCVEEGPFDLVPGGSFYTYDRGTDFDQDFQVDAMWLDRDHWQQYVFLRTHNGCDARGGFSSPVIAKARDPDYLYSWNCDLYCTKCGQGWENDYWYKRTLEEEWEPKLPLETWRVTLARLDEIRAGQTYMPGLTPDWVWPMPQETVRKILKYVDAQEDEDEKIVPGAIFDDEFKDKDGKPVEYPDYDMNSAGPSWATKLWCPDCYTYNVMVSGVANGF